MDFGSYISGLIEQVKGLFGGGTRVVAPQAPTTTRPQSKVISSPGAYTAPIHGTWHSSGGFTYTPNASHPTGHMGVDMRCAAGTEVHPLTSGIVTNVGTDPKGGNVVNVKHPNNITTYYAHLSTAKVHKGDKVDVNTVLGTVGNTGNAAHTFPHCHFQVWQDGQIQDPARYFAVPQYTDLSADEKANPWVSEQAKQEAQAFNMRDHVSARRVAFSNDINVLVKTADIFCKIAQEEPIKPEVEPEEDAGLKVWLDDVRQPPPGWTWVKTVNEAIGLLSSGNVKEISLDHDLGDWVTSWEGYEAGDMRAGAKELTGYDVVLWMSEHNMWPKIVRVHSQNSVGRERMEKTIDRYAPPGTRRPRAFYVAP